MRGLLAASIIGASLMAMPLPASAAVGVESVGDVVTITLERGASDIVVDEEPGSLALRLIEQEPTGPHFFTLNCADSFNNTTEMICPGSFETIYLRDDDSVDQPDVIDASASPAPIGIPAGQTPDTLDSPITLTGSDKADVMTQAGASADVLNGGNGADILNGGGGEDEVNGGAGADTIDAFDGVADTVDCGADVDSARVDPVDLTANCERLLVVPFVDADKDGFSVSEDCDDQDANIKPGATDVPGNGVDEDCDGKDAALVDADADGVTEPEDCDDKDATIRPGATDVPGNGIDEDCSGADSALPPPPDTDKDGIPDAADCDDKDAKIKPGALEIVGNKIDENCDGVVAPFPPIGSSVHSSFQVSGGNTRVVDLTVSDIPRGATIQLTCSIGHHGSSTSSSAFCPFSKQSFGFGHGPRQSIDLSGSFKKRKLKPGVVITVQITAPQTIGKQVQYKTRNGKSPAVSTNCLSKEVCGNG